MSKPHNSAEIFFTRLIEESATHGIAALGVIGTQEFADVTPIQGLDTLTEALHTYSDTISLEKLIPNPENPTWENFAPGILFTIHTIARHTQIPKSSDSYAESMRIIDEFVHGKHSSVQAELAEGIINSIGIAGIFSFPLTIKLLPELINHSESHPIAAGAFSLLLAVGGIGLIWDILKFGAIRAAKIANVPHPTRRVPRQKKPMTIEQDIRNSESSTPPSTHPLERVNIEKDQAPSPNVLHYIEERKQEAELAEKESANRDAARIAVIKAQAHQFLDEIYSMARAAIAQEDTLNNKE